MRNSSKMAATTKIKETQGGNQHNSLKHRQNPEKHIVHKRELQIQPLPLESWPQELPSPSCLHPQPLEEDPPILLWPHLSLSLSLIFFFFSFLFFSFLLGLCFWVGGLVVSDRSVVFNVRRERNREGSVFLRNKVWSGPFWTRICRVGVFLVIS